MIKIIGFVIFVIAMTLAPIGFLNSTYVKNMEDRVHNIELFIKELNGDDKFEEDDLKLADQR